MAYDIWLSPHLPYLSLYIRVATLLSMNNLWVDGQCHSDWCNYNEYCCGIDLCCNYLTGYWYIWLMSGLLVFSLTFLCCWLRYHKHHAKESVESRTKHFHYIPIQGRVASYGDEYPIHQQPPQIPFAHEAPIYTQQGEQYESQQQPESASYYPPPYNFIERRTPTAPPPSP